MFLADTLFSPLLILSSLLFTITSCNENLIQETFNRASANKDPLIPESACEKKYLQLTLDVCSYRVSIEHPGTDLSSCDSIVQLYSCQAEYICRKCSSSSSLILAELQIRFHLIERLKAAANCMADLEHHSAVQSLCKSRLPVFIAIAVIFGISAAITAFLVYFYAKKMSVQPSTSLSTSPVSPNSDPPMKRV